nr:hypothetical protein [Tanacetum cinerariifolium]
MDQFIIQGRTPVTLEESIGPSSQPQDDTSANIIRESSSPADAKTGTYSKKTNYEAGIEVLNIDEEKGEELSNTVALEEKTVELDEGHVGLDPAHPLSTPVIDLLAPKLVSFTIQEQVFTATTTITTTTTLPLLPHPQQQSTIDPSLASCVSTPEQRCVDLEKKHKLQDQTTQALSSKIFTSKLRDLPHKIYQIVNKVVKKDPPQPPPHDSDQSKKSRHDVDASSSKQPLLKRPQLGNLTDIKDAPSDSSQ